MSQSDANWNAALVVINSAADTHGAAGGEQVEDVVVKLGHVVACVQLGVPVPGERILLSDVHPQHRTHDPHQKPVTWQQEEKCNARPV